MEPTKELLWKVHQRPGLCSREEIACAVEYFTKLQEMLTIYQDAHHYLPQGLTLTTALDTLHYYVDRFEQ